MESALLNLLNLSLPRWRIWSEFKSCQPKSLRKLERIWNLRIQKINKLNPKEHKSSYRNCFGLFNARWWKITRYVLFYLNCLSIYAIEYEYYNKYNNEKYNNTRTLIKKLNNNDNTNSNKWGDYFSFLILYFILEQ